MTVEPKPHHDAEIAPETSTAQPSSGPDLPDESTRRWLRRSALGWYDTHGRSFSWRQRRDPYRVLVAELLLQRTRADLVVPVYDDFIRAYPNAAALAAATPEDLARRLHPLGFAHRSARIARLGRVLCESHEGRVPSTKAKLLTLPGVGEYIANAVLALGFGERRPLLDPNVIRLLERALGKRSTRARPRDDQELWNLVAKLAPKQRAADFGLALVDIGSLICRPRHPRCGDCPLRTRCIAFTGKLACLEYRKDPREDSSGTRRRPNRTEAAVDDYPFTSEELTRRLGFAREHPHYSNILQKEVRPTLRRFKCPKAGSTRQAHWIIDRAMAERVSQALGYRLR